MPLRAALLGLLAVMACAPALAAPFKAAPVSRGKGGSTPLTAARAGVAGLRLNPMHLSGSQQDLKVSIYLPGGSPSVSPQLTPGQALPALPVFPHPLRSERQAGAEESMRIDDGHRGEASDKTGSIEKITRELAPELDSLSKLKDGHEAQTASIGSKIEDIIVRRRNSTRRAWSGLSSWLSPRSGEESRLQKVSAADEALSRELSASPGRLIVFDYDNTLTDRGPDGLSLPISDAVLAGLIRLLEAGHPVGIATTRNFDWQSPDSNAPNTVFEPFISKIPARLRRNLYFSGGVGAELVAFDADGNPQRLFNQGWTPEEKNLIPEFIEKTRRELKVPEAKSRLIASSPGQFLVRLERGDPRIPVFAENLQARLAEAGLPYKIHHGTKYVYFSKFDKAFGVRAMIEVMRARGLDIAEKDLVVVGDHFRAPHGVDVSLGEGLPEARAFTVGDPSREIFLAPNVRPLDARASQGSLLIIEAVLEGLSKRSPPSPQETGKSRAGGLRAWISRIVTALTGPPAR